MKNVALILASGTGSRFGSDSPKQFAQVCGKTVLEHTIDKFQNHASIDGIIIVTNSKYVDKVKALITGYSKVRNVVSGGETRKDSSYNGIMSVEEDECNVLIHDGVRPLVSDEIITDCINALKHNGAVCVTVDSTDTIYETDLNGVIKRIPNRASLKRAQTPQCFKLSLIKKAHEMAKNDATCVVTDDCGLIMHYKLADINTIKGSENNIKVTFPEDLDFIKRYLN